MAVSLAPVPTDRRLARRRRAVAAGFARALADGRDTRPGFSSRIPVQRAQVVAAAPQLEELIARLRDTSRPVDPEGIWMAVELLSDGNGPLFTWTEPGTLRSRIGEIYDVLG